MSTAWITDSYDYHRRDEQEYDYTLEWGADNEVDPARCECVIYATGPYTCDDCLVAEWDAR
jgi:hypothetical protein